MFQPFVCVLNMVAQVLFTKQCKQYVDMSCQSCGCVSLCNIVCMHHLQMMLSLVISNSSPPLLHL